MANCNFVNYPDPKESDLPFQPPPTPKNPVVRGLALHYLSQLVISSSFVQDLLWSNAGFGSLRNLAELDNVAPRYEPTVIRTADVPEPLDAEEYLSALGAEDWSSKRPPSTTPVFSSALDYHEAYKSGRTTPTAVAETLLPLIRRDVNDRTPHSTAFLATKIDLVRSAAEASTQRYKAGKSLGPLDGVPMAVKDEADLTGYPKCLGSRLDLKDKADATSFCVAAWQAAGAVCVGKTTMHELGTDTTNLNPIHGTPENPYSARHYTGGSSGGSAAAVAAGLVPFALGNDGGGSVRIPAAYCGLYGLKTSHGRVSVRPTVNLAKSTGVPGPLAANMVDLELAYRVMARPDAADETSKLFAIPRSPSPSRPRPLLGICTQWFARADPAVRIHCQRAIDHLTAHQGYRTVEIASLPLLASGQTAHALTILAEINSALAAGDLARLSAPTRILLATGSRSSAVDLLLAQKARALLMAHLAHLFRAHPPGLLLLTPTTPNAGWPRAGNPASAAADAKHGFTDANTQLRNMEYVWLANFSGCPALTAPVGYVDAVPTEGQKVGKKKNSEEQQQQEEEEEEERALVPIGLMAMAEWCGEDDLIGFGYDLEKFLGLSRGEGEEGGRRRPRREMFVDVLKRAEGRRED